MAVASCLALTAIPGRVQAAGLGKIAVFSALGQPLRAEIELNASRDELSGMKAQLATPEAFKQAGLDYATTLLGIRFALDKRADGQPVIRLVSSATINDPFIDMLLELTWPSGRLVREYTFLLDPPEMSGKGAATQAAAVVDRAELSVGRKVEEARAALPAEEGAEAAETVVSPAPAKSRVLGGGAKTTAPVSPAQTIHEVKRGDTLSKIAAQMKPEDVSLEQMLVALLRANRDAFDGGNMNRLRTGKIIALPEKAEIEKVSSGEAKKVVRAQAADWNAYRSRLAAIAGETPVKEESARQEAGGKISAKVEEKVPPETAAKDRVKVSKTAAAEGKPDSGAKYGEEDRIAHEKAVKEANERVALLEKNVNNLQKLLELKNQSLAEMQKQAQAAEKPEAKAVAEKVATPNAQPAVAVAEVTPPKTESAPAAVTNEKPTDNEKVEEAKSGEPAAASVTAQSDPEKAAPPEAAQKSDDMPREKPKALVLPAEEPSPIDAVLDDPLTLAAGGGILALMAAFFLARRRGRKKGEEPIDLASTLSASSSSLAANSVFRSTGGQSVDTSHTPAQTDFSQAGPGSIDTDEVDPVAEADVYMAYGRDAQAEEILLEAKQKDPKRTAVYLKLLEIYANRNDVKQFEALATDLYSETGGVGTDWEKAAAMGLKLLPDNPLFGGASGASTAKAFDADATVIVSPGSRSTVTLPGELAQLADEASKPSLSAAPVEVEKPVDLTSLDFDLGAPEAKPQAASPLAAKPGMEETVKMSASVPDGSPLDFDLALPAAGASAASSAPPAAEAADHGLDFSLPEVEPASEAPSKLGSLVADLDFDLGLDQPLAASAATPQPQDVAASLPADDGVQFDVSLTESTFLGDSAPVASSFDMSGIDLDLKAPEAATPSVPPAARDTIDFDAFQVATVVNAQFEAPPQAQTAPPASQVETMVNPQFAEMGGAEAAMPEFEISANEEVTTKLDLAKAYEEMGDLEGARELLQEVIGEGDGAQREKAQAILARIGA